MKSLRKIVHEHMTVCIYGKEKEKTKLVSKDELTIEEAKTLLGWMAEDDPSVKEKFGDDYKLRDANGVKVRLANCTSNRPFRKGLAMSYANEILRNKWRQNGETFAIDIRDDVQEGQHRLVGFVMAEQMRKKEPARWKEYGTTGVLMIPAIIVFGISDEPDVVDTINLGQKRSLGDVLFRNREFTTDGGKPVAEKEQQVLANVLAGASRLVWLCLGGKNVSDSPKFVHSEALDLLEQHPRVKEAVDHIYQENAGSERQIQNFLSLGYAAGLMYLMAACKTNGKKWDAGDEEIDFSKWDDAEKFWTLFAVGADLKKGDPVLVLRNFLSKQAAGSGHQRDEIIAAVKLAWNAWIDEKQLGGVKDLKPGHEKNEAGKQTLKPVYMGGLDIAREPRPKLSPEPKPAKAKAGPKKKAAGKKAKKNVSYQFAEGDEVWVEPTGKDAEGVAYGAEDIYKARVSEIRPDGVVLVTPDEDKKALYEFDPSTDGNITLEKPKTAK